MKILAFGASSSRKSINKALVTHAVARLKASLPDVETEVLDLNDFEMPLFSVDREADELPDHAARFFRLIGEADGVVISFAEHNGNYTAAYKNLFDWASRIDAKVFQQKPVLALSTSPGKRGGASALGNFLQSAPHVGAELVGSLSVPSFYDVFDTEKGALKDSELETQLGEVLVAFAARVGGGDGVMTMTL
ncbi:MAG: chromate reductase [Polyangiales bacterium]|jgi:chromate reductase